jgi:hypothetical protein
MGMNDSAGRDSGPWVDGVLTVRLGVFAPVLAYARAARGADRPVAGRARSARQSLATRWCRYSLRDITRRKPLERDL